MKCYVHIDNYAKWLAVQNKDRKFEVFGGSITSDGTMAGTVRVLKPILDRRFRTKIRYVLDTEISCLMKGLGYPGHVGIYDFSNKNVWAEIEIGEK